MNISEVTFPLYKLRSYLNVEETALGIVKITSIKGTYILDDKTYNGTFSERRIAMLKEYPTEKIYKLKERINFLRQLIKYKSGTNFIDYNGYILKYKKSSKLFDIKSYEINTISPHDNWNIINLIGLEQAFLIGGSISPITRYASIMDTQWGPFLYDLTSKHHESYKRKI